MNEIKTHGIYPFYDFYFNKQEEKEKFFFNAFGIQPSIDIKHMLPFLHHVVFISTYTYCLVREKLMV
jgi:hypothetical protein